MRRSTVAFVVVVEGIIRRMTGDVKGVARNGVGTLASIRSS